MSQPDKDGTAVIRKHLLHLDKQRRAIEDEIASLVLQLNTRPAVGSKPPGVRGSLLDEEGFPRADLDHYSIKRQRHRLNCLQTDLTSIMKDIEAGLQKITEKRLQTRKNQQQSKIISSGGSDNGCVHDEQASTDSAVSHATSTKREHLPSVTSVDNLHHVEDFGDSASQPNFVSNLTASPAIVDPRPFAIIDDVAPNGPAAAAKLRVGDKIVAFGRVTAENSQGSLQYLAQEAQAHLNQAITIRIIRADVPVSLSIKPQTWEGRGILGCHVLPL